MLFYLILYALQPISIPIGIRLLMSCSSTQRVHWSNVEAIDKIVLLCITLPA